MRADDDTLVKQCLNGNRQAFEELVDRYQRPVFNAARRLLSCDDDARDVAQTVFLRAYERLGRFDFHHRFYSWLYRIAINESLRHLERSRPTEPLVVEQADATRSPEEAVHGAELGRRVQEALMSLKVEHRSVIVLRHFQQCSYREMAYILDLPEKTVKSRLFTARQVLRDRLAARGVL